MKNESLRQGGFTLVEVIVVLVILGVLLAIAIPNVINYIDKAQNVEAIAQCRACVNAAQVLSLERRAAKKGAPELSDKAEILTAAAVSGDIISLDAASYSVAQLLYKTEGGDYVTYKNGVYSMGNGTVTMGNPDIQEKLEKAFASATDTVETFDSGAAAVSTASNAASVEAILSGAGLSFSDLNAKSWQYTKNATNQFFYWSTVDINETVPNETVPGDDTPVYKYNPGDKVPVMRYNYKTGTYTVWIATVTKISNDDYGKYNSFKKNGSPNYEGYTPSTKQDSKLQTYDNMLEKYEQALKDYPPLS